jgi:hypothetical protein
MLLKLKVRGKAVENDIVAKLKQGPVYRSAEEGPGVSRIEQVSGPREYLRVNLVASAYDDKALKTFLAEFFSVPITGVSILRSGGLPEIDGATGLAIESTREMAVEIVGQTAEILKKIVDSIP